MMKNTRNWPDGEERRNAPLDYRLARKGERTPVEACDLPPPLPLLSHDAAMAHCECYLRARPKVLGLARMLARVGCGRLALGVFFGCCQGLLSTVVRPQVLGLAIRTAKVGGSSGRLVGVALAFGSAVFAEGASQMLMQLHTQLFVLKAFEIASTLVARRCALGGDSRAATSEVNLMGSDLVGCVGAASQPQHRLRIPRFGVWERVVD